MSRYTTAHLMVTEYRIISGDFEEACGLDFDAADKRLEELRAERPNELLELIAVVYA